jgi:hypothetical protein
MYLPALLRNAFSPLGDERGQDLIEYVLVTALVVFVAIMILDQVTPGISPFLQQLFGRGEAGGGL